MSEPDGKAAPNALRRLFGFVRPYRRQLALAVTFSLFTLVCQLAQPVVIKLVIDEVLTRGRRELLLPLVAAAMALGGTESFCRFARRNAEGMVSLGIEYDLRNRLYAHMQRLQVSFHDGWQSGQLVSRAITDISAIRRFLGFSLMWIAIFVATFVGVVIMLMRLDPWLALFTAACFLPVAYLSWRFARVYHTVSRLQQDQSGDLTTIVEEAATGVRIVKAFGRMPEQSALFREQAETLYATNLRAVAARSRFWSIDTLILNANLVVILLAGGLRVVHGRLTLGGLVAFVSYQLMLVWPVRAIGWIISTSQEARSAADRVYEVMDMTPLIADAPRPVELERVRGNIRFEGVEFTYPGTTEQILRGLDLDVIPGETLAVVGMTGSGKTTLASLVSRFYDPDGGRVTLDGHDLRDVSVRSLRGHVAVAFEDPILFSASIRDNLQMGKPDANDEEIWDALATAQADDFVRELPWGLNTRVGEQGYSLSGGQRQRLALARAVLGRPAILVLDDPLSSVDVHTEALIETALSRILAGRTALLVAHRPSTLLLSDRVALLHEGRMVATGTHHDLLETVPLYREVLAKDFEEEEVHA